MPSFPFSLLPSPPLLFISPSLSSLFFFSASSVSAKMLDSQFPDLDEILSYFQPDHQVTSQSGSEDTNPAVSPSDERKRRRMISNRESARRSRWRKKKHLENLSNEVNQLVSQNMEYKNRLGLVMHQCHLVGKDNERLTYEYLALRAKLYDLCGILVSMQPQ